jgi:hypothetical protein
VENAGLGFFPPPPSGRKTLRITSLHVRSGPRRAMTTSGSGECAARREPSSPPVRHECPRPLGKNGDTSGFGFLRRRHQGVLSFSSKEVHVRTPARRPAPPWGCQFRTAPKRRVAHGTERSRDERQGQHQHSRAQRTMFFRMLPSLLRTRDCPDEPAPSP